MFLVLSSQLPILQDFSNALVHQVSPLLGEGLGERLFNYREYLAELFVREFFFFGKEGDEGLDGASEEGALDLVHELTSIFHSGDKGKKEERLVALFSFTEGDELLLGENLHEGGNGGVGRLRFWIPIYNSVRTHRLCLIPQDVHDLHLGLRQRTDFLLIFYHVI